MWFNELVYEVLKVNLNIVSIETQSSKNLYARVGVRSLNTLDLLCVVAWFGLEALYVKSILSRHEGASHFRKSRYMKLGVLEALHGGKDHIS